MKKDRIGTSAGSGTRLSQRRQLLRRLLPYLLLTPTLLLFLLLLIIPLLLSGYISLLDLRIGEHLNIKHFVGLENYLSFRIDSEFMRAVFTTLRYMVGTISIELIVSLVLAVALSSNLPGIKIVRTFTILPMMTTPVILGAIFRLLFDYTFGWYNYFLSLVGIGPIGWLSNPSLALLTAIYTECWRGIPLVTLMLVAGISALPLHVFEAAKIDGASSLQVFRRVTLPLLRPIIILALIIRSTDAIHAFDQVYTLTRGGPGHATEVLGLAVYRSGIEMGRLGLGTAMSLILLVFAIGFGLLFVRFYQEYRGE